MHIENAYIVKSFKHVSIQKQVHLQLPGMFIVLKLKKLNKRIYMLSNLIQRFLYKVEKKLIQIL